MSLTDILNAYFPSPERPSELTIEVLDSCTNADRAPTAPTTISWCDGHPADGRRTIPHVSGAEQDSPTP